MLAKKYRLPKVVKFNNASFVSMPEFVAKVKPNKLLFNRLGVIISKKIDKRAVVRNRIKRLIHTIVQELQENTKQGYDILIIIKKNALGKTKENFYIIIKQFLEKGNLLKT